MERLLQVIYASAAVSKLAGDELEKILGIARTHNQGQGISGMLVYHDGSFLQVLEGPEEAVLPLLDKIKKDSRHGDFKLLLKQHVDEAEFEEWSMGFVDTTGKAGNMEGFLNYNTEFNAAVRDGSAAHKALRKFRDGIWRRYVEG